MEIKNNRQLRDEIRSEPPRILHEAVAFVENGIKEAIRQEEDCVQFSFDAFDSTSVREKVKELLENSGYIVNMSDDDSYLYIWGLLD